MNINHLKYFYDSVTLKSLKKGAERNNVSPGAVSQAILKLEQYFDAPLLHHSKNSLLLTDFGKKLMEHCPSTLKSVSELSETMKELAKPFSGDIYFGTQQSIASTFLSSNISKFNKAYPEIGINFTLGHTSNMNKLLDENLVDFIISVDNLDYAHHPKKILYEGKFVFIHNPNIKTTKSNEFLLTGETLETKQFHILFKKKYNKSPVVKMSVDSWGVIKQLALQGLGVGLIPDYLISKSERKFISNAFNIGEIKYTISTYYTAGTTLNKKSSAFIKMLKLNLN